jgi:hypothetical protein
LDFGMEALVVPVIGGATTYHSLILVPRSSGAASILDLRGRRLASADNMSNSGWLCPAVWLQNLIRQSLPGGPGRQASAILLLSICLMRFSKIRL